MTDQQPLQIGDLNTLVTRILADECNDPEGVIDDDLVSDLLHTFRLIFAEREKQLIHPCSLDDIRLITHASVTSTQLHHKNEPRWDGKPYVKHPRRARNSVVEDLGRTRPTLVSATDLHDSKEDAREDRQLKQGEFEKILISNYRDRSHARRLKRQIETTAKLVDAVTKKYRRDEGLVDRLGTIAATLRKLYSRILDVGLDAAMVRFADRRDNLRDYENHPKGKDRVHGIALETYEVFAQLAGALGLDGMAGILVREAVRTENINLLRGFDAERDTRYRERVHDALTELAELLDPRDKKEARARFLEKSVSGIEVTQSSLADFVLRKGKPLADIEIDDLNISSVAPLSRINVIISPYGNVEQTTNGVIDYIERNFVRGEEGDSVKRTSSLPGKLPRRGTLLEITSRRHGTVRVRIIDSATFARMKRGIIPVSSDNPDALKEFPPHLRRAMERIMAGSQHDERRVFPLSRDLLFPPMITVFDRDGKEVSLPRGSTPLDLAAVAVNREVTIGAYAAREILSDDTHRPIGLFDELRPGMRVEIISCLSKERNFERYDPNTVNPDPARMLFCRTESARDAIKEVLCAPVYPIPSKCPDGYSGTKYNIRARGREYTERIALLFGITSEKILEVIRSSEKRWSQAKDDAIFVSIGRGTIELISQLSGAYFANRREWRIRVRLRDASGVLERFLREFANKGINIDHIVEHHKVPADSNESPYDLLRLNIRDEHEDRSPFDIMRSILKLSMDYEIAIDEEPNFMRAFAGRLGGALIKASRPGGGD